jgi:hypothetical protein
VNKLNVYERAQVLAALVEGNSLRSTVRMAGIHRTTIQNLPGRLGLACSAYQDEGFKELPCKRLECDEIWSFVGAKHKNVTDEQRQWGWGDVWAWVALSADTKLVPCLACRKPRRV